MKEDHERSASPGPKTGFRFNVLHLLLAVWVLLFIRDFMNFRQNVQPVAYSQFITDVKQGKVSDVEVGPDKITGTFKDSTPQHPKEFITIPVPNDPALAATLKDANVKFTGTHESTWFRDLLSWVVPAIVLGMIWMAIFRRMGQGQRGGFLSLGKNKAKIYVEKDLKVRFEDVAGVEEAKEELKEVVTFLKHPDQYSRLGGRMPKGVLLVGPPGTGKTLLARAVAGEANVPFFSINGSEFVELFVGLGAARVRDLFEQARAQAPCIIFIDELDALGKARGIGALSGTGNDEKEQTLNQLLAELDGFDSSKGVVIIGATNRPEVLDPALLRAGRFDRQILVDKPDRLGRLQILQIHLKKVKLPNNPAAGQVDAEVLAGLTPGFSGADLANLVNEAALIATRRGAEAVELRDFTEAIERIVAGLEHKNRLLNPEEKRRVAYHEMGHAITALACGEGEAVHKVSIIPRGIGALGYTFRRPTEDRYLLSRGELESKMAIAMGGRAAEVVFFNDISTGAADDLDKATEIARAMITRYGMSDKLGLAILERDQAPILGTSAPMRNYEYSEQTAQSIDDEIKRLLSRAHGRALQLVDRYRKVIEEGAQILLTQETLDESQLKAVWERREETRAAHITQMPRSA